MDTFEFLLFGIIGLLVLFLIIAGIDEYKSEKFYLRKDEFKCASSHTVTTVIPQSNGSNGFIMIPHTNVVCDSYNRVK